MNMKFASAFTFLSYGEKFLNVSKVPKISASTNENKPNNYL